MLRARSRARPQPYCPDARRTDPDRLPAGHQTGPDVPVAPVRLPVADRPYMGGHRRQGAPVRAIPHRTATKRRPRPVENRWLSYMLLNGYMDKNIQKAFINGIPGCFEHQAKLATAIQEARRKHRSLTVCWLDLANAYGSVHHQLIHFTLNHYHAPSKLVNTVANLYTDLSATITTPSWATQEIPLQIGVFQGDPLSVVIFNTVMCTLIEALHPL